MSLENSAKKFRINITYNSSLLNPSTCLHPVIPINVFVFEMIPTVVFKRPNVLH